MSARGATPAAVRGERVPDSSRLLPRSPHSVHPTILLVTLLAGALLLFVFAVILLGSAVSAISPGIQHAVQVATRTDWSSLGAGWLASYLMLGGSPIAALSVVFFASGLIGACSLVMFVVGSRLGASAFVVVLGLAYWLRRGASLRASLSLGVLTLVVTFTLYVPATVIAHFTLPEALLTREDLLGSASTVPFAALVPDAVSTSVLHPSLVILVGLGLFVLAFVLVDRALALYRPGGVRNAMRTVFKNRGRGFLLGLIVTSLTASVAFSVGILVPLVARRAIRPRDVIAYLLGANIGTLSDTAATALVLGSGQGFTIVLWLTACAGFVAILALIAFPFYRRGVQRAHRLILRRRACTLCFALVLILTPALLVTIG